jgi:hypothetical protein
MMAASSKMNRTMAGLLTRDLIVHHLPELARHGVAIPPDLVFEFIDGASRPAARALLRLGMSTPQIQRALRAPAHRMVALYKDYAMYFSAEHPQEGDQPAPWTQRHSVGMRARIVDGRAFDPGYEVTPGEAKIYAEYIGARGDLQAIMNDRGHADHGALVEGMAKLMERASSPADPAVAPNPDQIHDAANGAIPPPSGGAVAAARQQINALLGDKEFMGIFTNRREAGHADAVKRMYELHGQLVPVSPASTSSAAPAAGPDVAAVQEKIATIDGRLRQYAISAPGRAALLDELAHLNSLLPSGTRPAQSAERPMPHRPPRGRDRRLGRQGPDRAVDRTHQ